MDEDIRSRIQIAIKDEEEAIAFYNIIITKLKNNIRNLDQKERRLLRAVAHIRQEEETHRNILMEAIR